MSRSAIMHFVESAGAVLYVYVIVTHTCVPVFPDCRKDYASLAVATFKVMLPGTFVALLAFYGFLHCWLNAFAELTRFADRQVLLHAHTHMHTRTCAHAHTRKYSFI